MDHAWTMDIDGPKDTRADPSMTLSGGRYGPIVFRLASFLVSVWCRFDNRISLPVMPACG